MCDFVDGHYLLMNSYNTDTHFLATTIDCSLSTLNLGKLGKDPRTSNDVEHGPR